jgi:hypothetical protein
MSAVDIALTQAALAAAAEARQQGPLHVVESE